MIQGFMFYDKIATSFSKKIGQKKVVRDSSPNSVELQKIRKDYMQEQVSKKVSHLNDLLGLDLKHINTLPYPPDQLKGNIENYIGLAQVPIGLIGPLSIDGKNASGDFYVPLATTEGALISTYDFGAKLLKFSDPIKTEIISNVIHISPMFPFKDEEEYLKIHDFVEKNYDKIKKIAEEDSRHTTLLSIEHTIVADNYILKFKYNTADAHGLNMINHATFKACEYIKSEIDMDFYHRSHFSGVKHHSPMNETEGYGRHVRASVTISKKALKMLGITARQLKEFCDRCIACGNAAGINSINVHAANAIAAIYIACGQDPADVSSSHVCRFKVELVNFAQEIYWEMDLPNLLVATVGGGTGLRTQRECLEIMGCYGAKKADKLAEIIAATILSGEFTTAAAVINKTYVEAHNNYGRNDKVKEIIKVDMKPANDCKKVGKIVEIKTPSSKQ